MAVRVPSGRYTLLFLVIFIVVFSLVPLFTWQDTKAIAQETTTQPVTTQIQFPKYNFVEDESFTGDDIIIGVITGEVTHQRTHTLQKTWGKYFRRVQYFSDTYNSLIPTIELKRPESEPVGLALHDYWGGSGQWRALVMMKYWYQHHPNVTWYLMVDDDTMLFPPNLVELLSTLNPKEPLYMGCMTTNNDVFQEGRFVLGGGGILMSNALLRIMGPKLDLCIQKYNTGGGDFRLGMCIQRESKVGARHHHGFNQGDELGVKDAAPLEHIDRVIGALPNPVISLHKIATMRSLPYMSTLEAAINHLYIMSYLDLDEVYSVDFSRTAFKSFRYSLALPGEDVALHYMFAYKVALKYPNRTEHYYGKSLSIAPDGITQVFTAGSCGYQPGKLKQISVILDCTYFDETPEAMVDDELYDFTILDSCTSAFYVCLKKQPPKRKKYPLFLDVGTRPREHDVIYAGKTQPQWTLHRNTHGELDSHSNTTFYVHVYNNFRFSLSLETHSKKGNYVHHMQYDTLTQHSQEDPQGILRLHFTCKQEEVFPVSVGITFEGYMQSTFQVIKSC